MVHIYVAIIKGCALKAGREFVKTQNPACEEGSYVIINYFLGERSNALSYRIGFREVFFYNLHLFTRNIFGRTNRYTCEWI